MAAVAYAVAFTVTLPGFSPGAGFCNQMPVTEPFWLLYPDSAPPQPGLLLLGDPPITGEPPPEPDPPPLPDPPPEPGLLPLPLPVLVFEGEPPHPTITRTWSANAKEEKKERKSRNIRKYRYTDVRCGVPSLFCPKIDRIPRKIQFAQSLCDVRAESDLTGPGRSGRDDRRGGVPGASGICGRSLLSGDR